MVQQYQVEGCFDLQVEADDTQEARTKAIRKLMGIATLTKEYVRLMQERPLPGRAGLLPGEKEEALL